jgi:hypothetical protein
LLPQAASSTRTQTSARSRNVFFIKNASLFCMDPVSLLR